MTCQACESSPLVPVAGADRYYCRCCRTVHRPIPVWPGVEIVEEYLVPAALAKIEHPDGAWTGTHDSGLWP